jgi:hypothetical protein
MNRVHPLFFRARSLPGFCGQEDFLRVWIVSLSERTKGTPNNNCYDFVGRGLMVQFDSGWKGSPVMARHFHCGFADLDAFLTGAGSSALSTLRPVLVVVASINSTTARRSVSGRPRQFCVMWQSSRCSGPESSCATARASRRSRWKWCDTSLRRRLSLRRQRDGDCLSHARGYSQHCAK